MKKEIILILVCFCSVVAVFGQKCWTFELMGGFVYNVPLPLVIEQKSYPDIRIAQALYATEPWISPYYWDWRFTRRINKCRFEFEAIHHKLFLRNKPAEVERFGISHGFNLLLLNYGRQKGKYIFKAGIGPVLLHPESTIRGKVYEEGPGFDIKGYCLNGIAFQLAAARQFDVSPHLFINAEVKIIAGFANMPVVDGKAKVRNLSLQLVFGPGVRW